MCICFDVIHERDRWTDGQTDTAGQQRPLSSETSDYKHVRA